MYILYSPKLDKHFIGACKDMERSIYEHNNGHSKFTSTGVPWTIFYLEEFPTLQEAKKRELELKRRKSRKHIESLVNNGHPNA